MQFGRTAMAFEYTTLLPNAGNGRDQYYFQVQENLFSASNGLDQ